MSEPKRVGRRTFLNYAIAVVATGVIVGAATYFAVPKEVTTVTAPGTTVTTTKTVTTTVAGTPTTTPPTTTTTTPQQWAQFPGVKVTVAVGAGGEQAFSGICYHYRPIMKQISGFDLEVIELAYADLPVKILADLTTGTGAYDMFIPCSNLLGDLVVPGYVHKMSDFWNKPGMPKWYPENNPASNAQCSMWRGEYYGVPWDNDAWYLTWNMKGMDAVLKNSEKRAEFKSKFGYDLNPYAWVRDKTLTWQKVIDMSQFFHNWDWNGDGSPDYGMTMGLRTGEQGSFWFYGFAAPWVVEWGPMRDNKHNLFFLDPETMEPLISSKHPGFVEAAKKFKEITKWMNPAVFTYTFAETWDEHLAKAKSMFLYQAPDTFSLVGNPDKSSIRGYLMTHPTPGVEKYWSMAQNQWVEKMNFVGNVCGCSWHPFISKLSKNPDAAYFFAAYVAQPREHLLTAASAYTWTGCDPGAFTTDILVDYGGMATLEDFNLPPSGSPDPGFGKDLPFEKQRHYNEGDLRRAQIAVWNNLNAMDAFEDYLRIPGATAMFTSVDTHIIGEMLTGAAGIKEALDRVYKDWNKIIDEYGRDKLKTLYQEMINYGQPNTYSPKPWKFDPKWSVLSSDVIF